MSTQPPAAQNRRGLVLIADDKRSSQLILKSIMRGLGYETVEASDGVEAISLFVSHEPDLVLMDVMMPKMDGYTAARKIKSYAHDRFVPIMFLTAITDEEGLSRCIDAGGDDVLTKPYRKTLLEAKIKAMERIRELHDDLRRLYSRMQQDQEIAEQVFSGAVLANNVALDQIHTLLKPAELFSGDLLLTAYSPSQDLHVMLGDFTGHGLAAAIGALPASEVFHAMTNKGFSPPQILHAINAKLQKLLPPSMFLAAQFIRISSQLDHVIAFNCGMPDFFLINGKTNAIEAAIKSNSLPLGITSDIDFTALARYVRIEMGDRMVMVSDGVTEARNPQGECFGINRLKRTLLATPGIGGLTAKLESVLNEFRQGAPMEDDISMAEIPLTPKLLPVWDHKRKPVTASTADITETDFEIDSDNVEFMITLRGNELRQANPVPMIINFLQENIQLDGHHQSLFTILTELYVNALDHGVLELDSAIKQQENGFGLYFEYRERLLQKSIAGFVRLGVRIHSQDKGGLVVIQVEDSGAGFDLQRINRAVPGKPMFCGRGIALIESLCESIHYFEPGNKAEAIYRWGADS